MVTARAPRKLLTPLSPFHALEFLDFAGRGSRHFGKDNVARNLVTRQPQLPHAMMSSAVEAVPGLSSMNAHGVSPHFSSGLVMTARTPLMDAGKGPLRPRLMKCFRRLKL